MFSFAALGRGVRVAMCMSLPFSGVHWSAPLL